MSRCKNKFWRYVMGKRVRQTIVVVVVGLAAAISGMGLRAAAPPDWSKIPAKSVTLGLGVKADFQAVKTK